MRSRKVFWMSILLLTLTGIAGCPLPPQQKGAAPAAQQEREIERDE